MRITISSVVPGLVLGFALCASSLSPANAQSAAPRLDQLHDALRLNAAQEEAWRAYTAALQPSQGAQARRQQAEALLPRLTTPRRIALLDATMQQDLADMRHQGQAVIAFYNALTPEQQAVFDRQTLQRDKDRGQ